MVLETGDILTLLDCFLELTGAHLHQHHLPSFCPTCALALPSQSSFCAVSYSHFSSLLSHPSYLLFSFQHFNRITYTFAPAWCLLCSAGTLPWGFSSFLFLAFISPILPLTSLNISFPHSGCLSLNCALFRYLLLCEMLIKDFNPLNIQDLHLSCCFSQSVTGWKLLCFVSRGKNVYLHKCNAYKELEWNCTYR